MSQPAAYYNECDPFAAQWLRNLIAAGHIAPGEVDERSITDVRADELLGFAQCHFFAGIGVWSHALRQAGWPDDQPIWTGSCPCQPFSAAGKQRKFDDERHLWPVWFQLIKERRPPVVVGEQVASALDWLDLVSADLESEAYSFGATDLCAAGFGGAHIRQRFYFVGLAHPLECGLAGESGRREPQEQRAAELLGAGGLGDTDRKSAGWDAGSAYGSQISHGSIGRDRDGFGNASDPFYGLADASSGNSGAEREQRGREHGLQPEGIVSVRSGSCRSECDADAGLAADAPLLGRHPADWLFCRDGKWRPVEPGTLPLAHEAAARVGRLRAYGNALDAETAAQFCGAVRDIVSAAA